MVMSVGQDIEFRTHQSALVLVGDRRRGVGRPLGAAFCLAPASVGRPGEVIHPVRRTAVTRGEV